MIYEYLSMSYYEFGCKKIIYHRIYFDIPPFHYSFPATLDCDVSFDMYYISIDIYRMQILIIEILSFERHRNNKQDDDNRPLYKRI